MIKRLKRLFEKLRTLEMFRLMKHSFVYGIGDIIQRSLSILLLPIYTRYLTPADYGVISLLTIISLIVGTITMCALTNGISRYFYYTDQEKISLSEVVWSPFLFIIVFTLIVVTALGAFSGSLSMKLFDSDDFSYLVVLTLFGVFVSNISGVGRSFLIFQEKAMIVSYVNAAGVLVGAASGIFFVVILKRGITGAVEAGLVGSAFMCVPIMLLTMARLKPAFSRPILKRQLKFSLPFLICYI